MVRSQSPTSSFNWRKLPAAILVVAGFCLVTFSFFWSGKARQLQAWSNSQAEQYQAASAKLHTLTHEISRAAPNRKQELKNELTKTQADYDVLRRDLESALGRPNRLTWAMRITGLLCIALGGGLLYYLPDSAGDENDGEPSKFVLIKREK